MTDCETFGEPETVSDQVLVLEKLSRVVDGSCVMLSIAVLEALGGVSESLTRFVFDDVPLWRVNVRELVYPAVSELVPLPESEFEVECENLRFVNEAENSTVEEGE